MTTIGDLAGIEAVSGVAVDTAEPYVQLRASSQYAATCPADALDVVLLGQLDPSSAINLGLRILEAASAAEFDAALYRLMLRRLGDDPTADAKAAAILHDLREQREQ